MRESPPPLIEGARVLKYALLDRTVAYSGHSRLFVGGKEVGPVPRLVIGKAMSDGKMLLFHCDNDWTVLGVASYTSLELARERANIIYPGVESRWVDCNFSQEEVSKYLNDVWGELRCTICGRRPDEVDQLIEKNGIKACNICIRELAGMLTINH